MSNTKQFTHSQPLGSSDPAHAGFAPGELTKAVPAVTPLVLDTTSNRLAVWDGQHAGAAYGVLAVSANQSSIKLAFYKSSSFRIEDVFWPDAVTNEHIKHSAFAGTAISIIWHPT